MVSFMLKGRRITTVKKRHPEGEIEMASARDPKDPRPLEVFNQYRGLLFSVAYRMLGSAADAGGHGAGELHSLATGSGHCHPLSASFSHDDRQPALY
jgi:hypothetical protein